MVSSICQWVTLNHPHGRDSPAESPPIYRHLKARTHGVPVSPPSAGQGADHLYGTPSLASWRYAWSEVGVPGWGWSIGTLARGRWARYFVVREAFAELHSFLDLG